MDIQTAKQKLYVPYSPTLNAYLHTTGEMKHI